MKETVARSYRIYCNSEIEQAVYDINEYVRSNDAEIVCVTNTGAYLIVVYKEDR